MDVQLRGGGEVATAIRYQTTTTTTTTITTTTTTTTTNLRWVT